jgi:hypothetical protein
MRIKRAITNTWAGKFALAALLCAAVAATAAIIYEPWPTSTAVITVDRQGAFAENLSGLYYQPASGTQSALLWGAQNDPSKLFKMSFNGSLFVNVTTEGWSKGKAMRYKNGKGSPDAEGITFADNPSEIFVSTERNGDSGARYSVLRFTITGNATKLVASQEWDLTNELPHADSNAGLEGIAWIPDSYLTQNGFIDDNTRLAYDPANYPGHGNGLFMVGLESNGMIYAYALNQQSASFVRVASFASGHGKIMDLSFDSGKGVLWAHCDNTCANRSHVMAIDKVAGSQTFGKFIVRKAYERPASLVNSGHEGIAIAPESECSNNQKNFFWADDDAASRHSIRRGTIPCGPLF